MMPNTCWLRLPFRQAACAACGNDLIEENLHCRAACSIITAASWIAATAFTLERRKVFEDLVEACASSEILKQHAHGEPYSTEHGNMIARRHLSKDAAIVRLVGGSDSRAKRRMALQREDRLVSHAAVHIPFPFPLGS